MNVHGEKVFRSCSSLGAVWEENVYIMIEPPSWRTGKKPKVTKQYWINGFTLPCSNWKSFLFFFFPSKRLSQKLLKLWSRFPPWELHEKRSRSRFSSYLFPSHSLMFQTLVWTSLETDNSVRTFPKGWICRQPFQRQSLHQNLLGLSNRLEGGSRMLQVSVLLLKPDLQARIRVCLRDRIPIIPRTHQNTQHSLVRTHHDPSLQ